MRMSQGSGSVPWKILVAAVALLAIVVVGAVYLGVTAYAGDSVAPRSSPAGIEVRAPVAADKSVSEALVDGIVTRAEYDQAVLNVMACLADKGISLSDPVFLNDRDSPRWQYTVGPYEDGRVDEQSAAYDECFFRYEADIQAQWDLQHQPSFAVRTANETEALQCASDLGFSFDSYHDLLQAAWQNPKNPEDRLTLRPCLVIADFGFDPREQLSDEPPADLPSNPGGRE